MRVDHADSLKGVSVVIDGEGPPIYGRITGYDGRFEIKGTDGFSRMLPPHRFRLESSPRSPEVEKAAKFHGIRLCDEVR